MKRLSCRVIVLMMVGAVFSGFGNTGFAQRAIPTAEQQIEAALLAAPQPLRANAKVYGYTQQGEWVTLREGANALICIADDPQRSNFHVACYHRGLEPFMKRGRELRANGLTRQEVDRKRREEIESGALQLPQKAMTLYSISGDKGSYDFKTGNLQEGRPLTVVYVPFGTVESTGMTTAPVGPGGPWLMEPGTPWAHIMIPGRPVGSQVEKNGE